MQFDVTMRDLRLPRWQAAAEPLRLVHLSDLHLKGAPRKAHVRIAEWLHRSVPDMILLTGDLVSRPWAWTHAVRWLSTLPAAAVRLAVPGNWDYRFHQSYRDFEMRMRAAGFTALRNEACTVRVGGTEVTVVGIDDIRRGLPDPAAAFGAGTAAPPVIVMVHNPDQLPALVEYPSDLILCGHTHGGQLRIPGYGALVTSSRYGKRYEGGLYEEGGKRVYVSRGLGTGNLIPIRVACPPEIVCMTLYPAEAPPRKAVARARPDPALRRNPMEGRGT